MFHNTQGIGINYNQWDEPLDLSSPKGNSGIENQHDNAGMNLRLGDPTCAYCYAEGFYRVSNQPVAGPPPKISTDMINTWKDMPAHQREQTTMSKFIRDNKLNRNSLNSYVKSDGTLTARGLTRIGHSLDVKYTIIRNEHIKIFQEIKASDVLDISRDDFAKDYNLSPACLSVYIRKDGSLTPKGSSLME
ncbi:hypothetical protein [Biostraticola tofi]|uniref:Uncharacterized protein n=1 Tax=Biostraticola tofi TaxID=466109 RepID=A0A4R3YG36_9GAMM|nr:hypothetical protein [Biostraticola tofi]TCV91116.1 hypothetical protein EDC52_12110 [Biostraticola tofi]